MLDLDELEAKARAVPVTHLEIDRVLSIADQHADESREDGVRLIDRGGLVAFASDVLRAAANPATVLELIRELRDARAAVAAERDACADAVRAARDEAYWPGVRGAAARQALSCVEQAIRARGEKGGRS